MKTSEILESWLETLNEISSFLELYIASEEDKRRIKDLDKIIDDIYNFLNELKKQGK